MKHLFSIIFMIFTFSFFSVFANDRPKVSIVMPVYGVEKWLRECMDSLVNQTLKEIEIICVDDGSPDNCGKILDEYAEKDSRVKVIHQKNSGVQAARNAGLDIATGEYVALVDSDDYLELTTYETLYNYAKKDDVDVIHFGNRTFNDGDDTHQNNLDYSDTPVITLEEFWHAEYGIYVWDNLFKYDVIQKDKIRFIPEIRPADDTCFSYSAMGRAKRIKSIPAKFYNYRIRPCALSRMTPEDIFINSYKMFKHICDSWRQGDCLKGRESLLLSTIIRWSMQYHDTSLNYAQEVLDSFGDDIYNPTVVSQCPEYIQEEIKSLETAAFYSKHNVFEDGIYRIVTALNDRKGLSISGESKDNNGNLELCDDNINDNQKFKVVQNKDGSYTITALHSGKAIDVHFASKKCGANISQYEKNNTSAQKWYIIPCENGYYKLISQCNYLAMDVAGAETENGTNIQCWQDNGTPAQRFKFIKVRNISDAPISIAMSSDQNYTYPTIVTMTSILENKNPDTKINFYIMLSGDFEQKFKDEIMSLKNRYPDCEITLIDMKDRLLNFYLSGHITAAAYFRLLLPELLPDIDKILYLDTDIIVQKDLTELFNFNIDNFYLAGVLDLQVCGQGCLSYRVSGYDQDIYTQRYGLDCYSNFYVNSGVLLFNLKSMRENNLVPELLKCAASHNFLAHDQCVLNMVCYGKILPLSDIYNRSIWLNLKKDQVIVHYCGGGKPWKDLFISYADLWWKYAEKTPCFDKILEKYFIKNGTYIISSALDSNKVLDIESGSNQNFANLQLWDKNYTQAQKFYVKYIGDRCYMITAKCSGKAIDVSGANTNNKANVCQYKVNNTDAQKWYIVPDGKGYFTMVSKCNKLNLDVSEAKAHNGSNIQCWCFNGTNAQKFKFEKVN